MDATAASPPMRFRPISDLMAYPSEHGRKATQLLSVVIGQPLKRPGRKSCDAR
jgi:hypothetical protein